uniref:Uncharacterized protein n=1 Tax=Salarias fasciatus TaxID=181472 RepID=A0A672F9J5_SALFA
TMTALNSVYCSHKTLIHPLSDEHLGAPRTAVYKFVRCNPEDDDANCVTQQTQEMEWSPDLPGKLPASAAQNL